MDPGTKIFLLHGLGAAWKSGISLIPLQIFLWGCGFKNVLRIFYPADSSELDQSVKFVDAEMTKYANKRSERVVVIGQSMGGLVANSLHKEGWDILLGIYIGSPLQGAEIINKIEERIPTWIADCLRKKPYEFLKAKGRELAPPHPYKTISMGWGWSNFDHCVYRKEVTIDDGSHTHLAWADHVTIFANPRLWFTVRNLLLS